MGPANKMFKFTSEIKQTRNDVVLVRIEDKHYLQKLKIMSMTEGENC